MPPRRRSSSPLPLRGLPKKPKYLAAGGPTWAFQRCGKLLDKLLKHEDGWVFAKPVDARGLGILDYYTKISDPMDLGTVGRRLERHRYASPRAFAEDIRLVFRNAMSYNKKGDDVYKSAAELSRIFESGWASILAKLPRVPSVEERIERLKGVLPRLPVDVQGEAVAIMKERGRCDWEGYESAQVDFDLVNEATLGELERLVTEHKHDLAGVASNTMMQKQKCKEGEPDAIYYFKECHNSSKKGFIEPVKEAIAQMETLKDQVPTEDSVEPKTSTQIVAEVLSQSSAKSMFLRNVGLKSTSSKDSKDRKVQQLQNALAAEKEISDGFVQEVDTLKERVRKSDEKLLKYQEEMEALRKRQAHSDAILAEVLKQVKVNLP